VNRSAHKHQHELARKKHRHDQQQLARELAKKKPSMAAFWILAAGLVLVVVFAVATAFF
jgi:hypothetical protein